MDVLEIQCKMSVADALKSGNKLDFIELEGTSSGWNINKETGQFFFSPFIKWQEHTLENFVGSLSGRLNKHNLHSLTFV